MEFTILLSISSGESSLGILEFILDSYLMIHRYRCILLICQRNGKSQFTHDSTVISSTIIFLLLLSCLFWSIQEIYSWYWITMPYLYNLSSWPWFISLYLNYFTTLDSTTIWAWSWSQSSVQFSSVQLLSCVRLFATPWIAACQASLFITNSQSLHKLMCIESVMPSSHPILCRPLLLLPPIPPSFSNESTLRVRWPKY